MRRTLLAVAFAAALGVVAPTAQGSTGNGRPESHKQRALQVSVFATGLNNPRGLTFGPNRNLYVAEGGLGGTDATTPAQCAQVVPPVGPYTGSTNDQARGGRISRVSPNGVVTPVVVGLPSSQTGPMAGPVISGVADVEFLRGSMY